jgi:hypothetical protein
VQLQKSSSAEVQQPESETLVFRGFDLKHGSLAKQLESLTAQMSPDMQKCFLPVDKLVEAAMAGYDTHFLQL